ncbi:ArnT family glycosyltransferase [Sphaerisporangium perillae]|uniref:ArnT family glycosyltransferase n=1 Tax=Sphaerisporangium perillae TaxID=2935860 RepID=UPI00200F0C48|nr:glycosyltransferase family 39 protein [Sphaerisporangium perillae]
MTTTLSEAVPQGSTATWQALIRRRPGDARWTRPAFLALLAGTAVLYLWGLGASGWANPFYSAAVQAGTVSWKAFFFGSSDAANFITVDKAPAALWPMELSARIFGLNPWSILVPQALMGVATVAVLYATVRRHFGPGAGLLAGAVLALTPVAALMFRFDNPDALLVLLLTLAAYGMVRAQERGRTGWLVFAASCVGTAFLAKMLQAFVVVPGFALTYLATAPVPVGRRIRQLLAAGAAMVVAAGWWVAAVALVPAGSRPYIGGSQTNSVLELALGYNGFGRLTGEETGGLGNLDQEAGLGRLLDSEMGAQISWLLPAALLMLAAGVWLRRRAPRTDPVRAGFVLWGGWLLVTGVIFSLSRGIIHPYYTVALAPAVAALTGMGAALLWRNRRLPAAPRMLTAAVAVTACWSYVLLARVPDWYPALRYAVLIGGLVAAAALLGIRGRVGPAVTLVLALAVAASIAGPAAYAAQTASTPHSGAIPSAGPGGGFGPGGGGPGGMRGGGRQRPAGVPGQARPGNPPAGIGQGQGGNGNGGAGQGQTGNGPFGGGQRGNGPGGGMSLLFGSTPSAELTALLTRDAASYTWVAAAVGSNSAAGYQLATGLPVMAVGGFNGTDPAPTLEQFQRYVAEGKIHYFVGGGMMGGRGGGTGSDQAQKIVAWVQSRFTSTTAGGTTVYDLTTS